MQGARYAACSELLPEPGALRRCLVVGSGVAGLQVARQLLKLNLEVLVLESSSDVGGVWMQNYVGYSLQVPWHMYQFPEFLWPKHLQPAQEYPTGKQVQEYIRAYVAHFDLMRHIRLHCKLLRLRWIQDSHTWDALYCDTTVEKFYKVSVDYVVMCSGIYNTPFIPSYLGADTFQGTALHARDFTDLAIVRGRRVLVVGSGKTALDCVSGTVASRCAASVTMLYRQAHWPVPRSLCGLSIRNLLFNRATAAMLPPYYTASQGTRVAEMVTKPIKRLFWRGLENLIARRFRITKKLKPQVRLPKDLFYGGQILDDRVDEHLKSKELTMIRGEINCFVRNGVILQDGSFLPVDVILYCTGYDKKYDYLSGDFRARLGLQKDGLYLYRNILPPAVPHLAYVGSEVSTYNNILTHGLQALWLAHVLSGHVKLPAPAAMDEDVRSQQRWRREVIPPQRLRGSVLALYMAQYHDQLLTDIGVAPRRKTARKWNPLSECFGAYSAEDYSDVLQERMRLAAPPEAVEVLRTAQVHPPRQVEQHELRQSVQLVQRNRSDHSQQHPHHNDDPEQSEEVGLDELTCQYDERLIAAALRVSEQQLSSEGNASLLLDTAADETALAGIGGRRGLTARLEALGVGFGTESGYTNSSGASIWGPRSCRGRPSSLAGSAVGITSGPGDRSGNGKAGENEAATLCCIRAAASAAAAAAVVSGEAHRTRESSNRVVVIAAAVAAARAAALAAYNAAAAASGTQRSLCIRPAASMPQPRTSLDANRLVSDVCRRSSTEPVPAPASRPCSTSAVVLSNSAPHPSTLSTLTEADGASSVGMLNGRRYLPSVAVDLETSTLSPFIAPTAVSLRDGRRCGLKDAIEPTSGMRAAGGYPARLPPSMNWPSPADGFPSSQNALGPGFCDGDPCNQCPSDDHRGPYPQNGATAAPVLHRVWVVPAANAGSYHSGPGGYSAGGGDRCHSPLPVPNTKKSNLSTSADGHHHQHGHRLRSCYKYGDAIYDSPLATTEVPPTAGIGSVRLLTNELARKGVGGFNRTWPNRSTAPQLASNARQLPSGVAAAAGHGGRVDNGLASLTAPQDTERQRRLAAPSWTSHTAAAALTHSVPTRDKRSNSGDSVPQCVLLGGDADAEVFATVAAKSPSDQAYASPRGICMSISNSDLPTTETSPSTLADAVGLTGSPSIVGGGSGMSMLSSTGASSAGTVSPRPSLSLWYTPNPTPPGNRRCSAASSDHHRGGSVELQRMSAELRPVPPSLKVPAGGGEAGQASKGV